MGLTAFAALATGFSLYHRLFYLLGILIVLSFIWNWISLRWLTVTVERRAKRVRVGDRIHDLITVTNESVLPKPVIEVEDVTDLPGYSNAMAMGFFTKGSNSWTSDGPARKRGVYSFGPVRVSNTDAFGLFQRDMSFGSKQDLVVYPKLFDVPGFSFPAAHLSGEGSSRKRTHDLTPHAASVREYAFGDSMSRVHWNSTAKMGRLMSKDFDMGHSSDVWVIIDLSRDTQAGDLDESTDEYAVSIGASLAKKHLDAQLPVGLIAYGDRRYFLSADTGAGQQERIMEFLAMSKAEGAVPLDQALVREEELWGYNSSLIVITASHLGDWVSALRELTRRRSRAAVALLDARSFGGAYDTLEVVPDLYSAGIPPYVVSQGDDIRLSLSRVYTTPSLQVSEELITAGAAT
jgi:uncharacterized protein (DUF58 family)